MGYKRAHDAATAQAVCIAEHVGRGFDPVKNVNQKANKSFYALVFTCKISQGQNHYLYGLANKAQCYF
jgi:hypothetical protein